MQIRMYLTAGGHDNVVALRALCQHEGAMHLVLEYCPRYVFFFRTPASLVLEQG